MPQLKDLLLLTKWAQQNVFFVGWANSLQGIDAREIEYVVGASYNTLLISKQTPNPSLRCVLLKIKFS